MPIFDVFITIVQSLENVNLEVWKELITQVGTLYEDACPAFTNNKLDALCEIQPKIYKKYLLL
jgi:hypothetical protein